MSVIAPVIEGEVPVKTTNQEDGTAATLMTIIIVVAITNLLVATIETIIVTEDLHLEVEIRDLIVTESKSRILIPIVDRTRLILMTHDAEDKKMTAVLVKNVSNLKKCIHTLRKSRWLMSFQL